MYQSFPFTVCLIINKYEIILFCMIRTFIAVSVLAAYPAIVLQACVIYSDFGSGASFDQDAGDVVSQSSDLRPSFAFTSASAQQLTEVDFVTSIGAISDLNQVTVSLSTDDEGRPGTALASQEFTNAMGLLGGEGNDPPYPPTIIPWILSTPEDLLAGNTYWITLDGPAPGEVTWNYNNQLQSGYSEFESGSWVATSNTLGAIQILGQSGASSSPSPEPRTSLLLGLGLLGVIAFKFRA
jgi:hypothetical protein